MLEGLVFVVSEPWMRDIFIRRGAKPENVLRFADILHDLPLEITGMFFDESASIDEDVLNNLLSLRSRELRHVDDGIFYFKQMEVIAQERAHPTALIGRQSPSFKPNTRKGRSARW